MINTDLVKPNSHHFFANIPVLMNNWEKKQLYKPNLPFILNHGFQHSIDIFLTVTKITTLNKVHSLLAETTSGIVQFEAPKERWGLFEVRSNGVNFVDKILHAEYSEAAKTMLDSSVSEGKSLTPNLAKTTLIDQTSNTLQGGISPRNVWINKTQHTMVLFEFWGAPHVEDCRNLLFCLDRNH